MISVLVLAILAISLVSIASYTLFQTTMTHNTTIKSITLSEELRTVKKALILSAKNDLTYGTVLPLGVNESSFHKLPAFVYLKTKNVFSKEYVYCPFSVNQNALNQNVQLTDSLTYMVDTASITHNGIQRDYVISSHNSPFHSLGVQAIIISPIPPFTTQPSCLGVQYDTELQVFSVEGGKVEVITTTDILIGI